MGIFKNKKLSERELKDFDTKIKLIYNEGIPELPQNTTCEIAIRNAEMIVNPLAGPERRISLEISQIKSISVLPWGEYALKYSHTTISVSKNSPGREYLIIYYTASDGSQKMITFWGSAMLLKMQKFVEKINEHIPASIVHL